MKRLIAALGAFLMMTTLAHGQAQTVRLCIGTNPANCTAVSATNPLPTSSAGGGGAATIANGADIAEGSTTDAPAAVPTSATAATTIALLKALNNQFTSGTAEVQGTVANGATDSGNPLKVGGIYNTTLPTLTAGQRGDLQINANGVLRSQSILNSAAATDAQSNTVGFYQSSGTVGTPSFLLGALGSYIFNGATWDRQRSITGAIAAGTGTAAVAIAPTSAIAAGITPVVSAAAENNHVLKATPGNLYSIYAANLTATAGFLVVLNVTAAPADGAITPLECAALPANGNASISYNSGPPSVFSTGITAVVTSATTCFTKTTGVITAFIRGSVQ